MLIQKNIHQSCGGRRGCAQGKRSLESPPTNALVQNILETKAYDSYDNVIALKHGKKSYFLRLRKLKYIFRGD